MGEQVPVCAVLEALAEKVTDMTKYNDQDVAYVCCQKNVVGGVLLLDALVGVGGVELRRIPILLVAAVTELSVHRCEDLFGRWGVLGVRQPVYRLLLLV